MSEFKGKCAIVTGGGAGIGKAVALAFAKEGANVVITGRTKSRLDETAREIEAAGGKALALQADAASRDDAAKVVAEAAKMFGRIDYLINNAQTTGYSSPIGEIGEEEYRVTLDSGLGGTLYFMQETLPHLKDSKGAIVNFGSRQGVYGAESYGMYAATKEAIRGLSRVAAREMGPFGIRVNVVNPAAETDAASEFFEKHPGSREYFEGQASLRRMGTPEGDIAPVVLFLCSEAANYVSGQTINVEGGQVMF